jgi:membrane protease YdiL (CAAX protease family)
MITEAQRRSFSIALLLGAASAGAAMLSMPYVLAMFPQARTTPLPLPLLTILGGLQSGGQAFAMAWLGLTLGKNVGLGAPVLSAWFGDGRSPQVRWLRAALIGVGTGAFLLAIDRVGFLPFQPERIRSLATTPAGWRGLLASFYGGILEEVMTRLFLMTTLVWLGAKFVQGSSGALRVTAIVLSALLFAAGHLPAVTQLVPLDAAVVARVITLNTAGGVVFGLVYWRWGIEHAMVSHFCADALMHTFAG